MLLWLPVSHYNTLVVLRPKLYIIKKNIFLYLQELHEIHSGLLRQLRLATENCVPGNGTPRLADVFLAWRERLLLYGDYCSNLTNAQDTLKALDSRDSTFSKQLAVIEFFLVNLLF